MVPFLIIPYYVWLVLAWKASRIVKKSGYKDTPKLSNSSGVLFLAVPSLLLALFIISAVGCSVKEIISRFLMLACPLSLPIIAWLIYMFHSLSDANRYRISNNPFLRVNHRFFISTIFFLLMFAFFRTILGRYAITVTS